MEVAMVVLRYILGMAGLSAEVYGGGGRENREGIGVRESGRVRAGESGKERNKRRVRKRAERVREWFNIVGSMG